MFSKSSLSNNPHDYVEERLSAFIDGQLSEEERAQVRKHLQSCSRCQTSLDTLGWTVKLLKQVPPPPLPRQFTLPVPEPNRARAPLPWLKWGLAAASAAAALALVFILTVDLLSQPGGRAPSAFGLAQSAPAARVQPTLVAAAAPTSAPPANDQAAPPTAAPIPEAVPPLPPAPSQIEPTTAAQPTRGLSLRESTAPTETEVPVTSKLTARTPICSGCGGGVGGGPSEETPQPLTITAASAVVIAGSVKDGPLSVRSAPTDRAPRLGFLARGLDLQILDRDPNGDWLKIVYPMGNDQGSTGWVMAKFVSVQIPIDSIPTAEPPTVTPTPLPGMSLGAPEGVQVP